MKERGEFVSANGLCSGGPWRSFWRRKYQRDAHQGPHYVGLKRVFWLSKICASDSGHSVTQITLCVCILFTFSFRHHNIRVSVLCNNRDEWMTRPTQPAHWHSFNHEKSFDEGAVLSGIDITAGGTWFGINKRGKIALL